MSLYRSLIEPKVQIEEWNSIHVVNHIDLKNNLIMINDVNYKIQNVVKQIDKEYIVIYLNCLKASDFVTIKLIKDRKSEVKTLHIDKYKAEEIYF